MQYTFKPTILLTCFCFILLAVFLTLGIWQVDRASEKKQLKSFIEGRLQESASSLNTSTKHLEPYQKVTVEGRYRPDEQFLLDNIIHQGKPGYYLLSPFEIADTEQVILVNQGWLPQGKNRQVLPTLNTPTGDTHLSGVLAKPRSIPVVLGGIEQPVSDNPPLWYYMDMDYFEKTVGYQVLPLVLKLDPSPNSSLIREWPKFKANSGMHIGYAIQWFVFALFVLIAFLGKSIKKNNKGLSHD